MQAVQLKKIQTQLWLHYYDPPPPHPTPPPPPYMIPRYLLARIRLPSMIHTERWLNTGESRKYACGSEAVESMVFEKDRCTCMIRTYHVNTCRGRKRKFVFTYFFQLCLTVSRGHGAGINLSVACRPSVRRPCRNYLCQNLLGEFLSNFMFYFHWAIRPDVFWIFGKICIFQSFTILFIYLFIYSFPLTWDPIGARTSKRYSSLQSLLIFPNLSWLFFSLALTKVPLWNF